MPQALESSTYFTKLLFCADPAIADGDIYPAYSLHPHGAFTWGNGGKYTYILIVYMYMTKIKIDVV